MANTPTTPAAAILEADAALWRRAERLQARVLDARNALALAETKKRTISVELEAVKLNKQEAISPVPGGAAKEKMRAIERAFGIQVSSAGKGKLRLALSFSPPVPPLRILLDVSGSEVKVPECIPMVVGIDRLLKEVNNANGGIEGGLAKFLFKLRAAHLKQRK